MREYFHSERKNLGVLFLVGIMTSSLFHVALEPPVCRRCRAPSHDSSVESVGLLTSLTLSGVVFELTDIIFLLCLSWMGVSVAV